MAVVDRRLPFTDQVERYRRQRQWLIDLEHRFDPDRLPVQTSQSVAQAVEEYLLKLTVWANTCADAEDQNVVAHIDHVVRSFGWGLFTCYDVVSLPRTNNALERFIRQLKMGHRRISGRKHVHDFIIRYGAYAAFVDDSETENELLIRLKQVSHDDFLQERAALAMALLREQQIHRFRYHRASFLAELEQRWEEVVSQLDS
jgi:hypothetical protein